MPIVAVIDIGKTNKKVALVDERFAVVASRQSGFPAQTEDGVLCEQVDAIWSWLKTSLAELYREHAFAAIVVSTHGACWAALDAAGQPTVPVIAYEHDLGDLQTEFDRDFYRLCGDEHQLQEETGSCDLPLLVNPAKAILFAQRRYAERWRATARIVNYPQYWGFLLTGAHASEATYSANHSFLFDIRTRGPSRAARALGVDGFLDFDFKRPWDRLGVLTEPLARELGSPRLPVAIGIHDSNAALLPYLVSHPQRDFVLNSTGTWCVAMHRVTEVRYRPDELGQKVIFNIDALGQLQKTSFLMGGQDYGLYHGLIGGADPGFDAARVDAALARTGDAVLPGAFPSQFPRCRGGVLAGDQLVTVEQLKLGERPGFIANGVAGHDLLNVSLALQSRIALARTDIRRDTTVFVEGGFRNNPTFLAVLSALLPDNRVTCTNLANATISGAAMLGHAMLAGSGPEALADRIVIEEKPIAPPSLPHLAAYQRAWLAAVS